MEPVQGYLFDTVGEAHADRNNTVCKIIARATSTDTELLDYGPAFEVEFGDGFRTLAYSAELNPWYPT